MKKIILLACIVLLYSCLNSDNDFSSFQYEFVKIDEAITPSSFTYGEIDSITVKYTFPNSCYSFYDLHYEKENNSRVVAITALVNIADSTVCSQATIEKEYTFAVHVLQEEDYIFKFWKGKNSNGDNLFEEIVIPVN